MKYDVIPLGKDDEEEAYLCKQAWLEARAKLPDAWIADPMQRYQMVGYEHASTGARLRAFEKGELNDLGDAALLVQDVLEAGMVTKLDLAMYQLASHFVNVGICTINGRMLQ